MKGGWKSLTPLETSLEIAVKKGGAEQLQFLKKLAASKVILCGRLQDEQFEPSTFQNNMGLLVIPIFTHKVRAEVYAARMKLQEEAAYVEVDASALFHQETAHALHVNAGQEEQSEAMTLFMSPLVVEQLCKQQYDEIALEEKQ